MTQVNSSKLNSRHSHSGLVPKQKGKMEKTGEKYRPDVGRLQTSHGAISHRFSFSVLQPSRFLIPPSIPVSMVTKASFEHSTNVPHSTALTRR